MTLLAESVFWRFIYRAENIINSIWMQDLKYRFNKGISDICAIYIQKITVAKQTYFSSAINYSFRNFCFI